MITPPNRGWCGTSLVCTRSITSFQRAPSWVTNSAVPSTESRVAPLSHALNVNVPEIGVTLLEYGPFFTCDSSPSRSSPKALRIGAALSGKGRSEEHTSELQSRLHLVCRLLLEKKKKTQ